MSATMTMERPVRTSSTVELDSMKGQRPPPPLESIGPETPSSMDHPDDAHQNTVARGMIKELSCHASMLIAGWSDASSGPLIPYLQSYFGVSYTVVSMLFVGQAVGFLASAGAMYFMVERLGFGKVIVIGAALQAFAYALLIPAFPFPVFPVLYAISGFGMAIQDSQANVYIATLPNADRKLGFLHASYGLGAALCPLAATAFASHFPRHFSKFWSISLAIALLNIGILLYAFRFNYVIDVSDPVLLEDGSTAPPTRPPSPRQEVALEAQTPQLETENSSIKSYNPSTPPRGGDTTYPPEIRTDGLRKLQGNRKEKSIVRQALLNRTTILSSIFILFYVGSEVSMGGWIVTFLIDNRGGGPSAGYVATGFWLGLTVGRAALNPLTRWVGEKRIVYMYLAVAFALEFAVWFADSFIGNAVVVSLVGVVIGPIYPILMSLITKLFPRKFHGPSIAFIASFGQVGSAIFPFLTGALAQKFNPAVLQPVLIVLFAVQFALWFAVPDVVRKKE